MRRKKAPSGDPKLQISLPMDDGKVYNLYAGVDPRFIGTISQGTVDDQEFLAFHKAHPEVLEQLIRLARKARDVKKQSKIGIRMLWEVLRWESLGDREPLKLNDRWHSRYVRLICATEPELKSMFTTRSLKT